jgi:hypothetical protein
VGGVGVIAGLLLLVGAGLVVAGVFLLWGPAWALIMAGVFLLVGGVASLDVGDDTAAVADPAPPVPVAAPGLTRVGR